MNEHAQRRFLQAEIHARPSQPLRAPLALSYVVSVSPPGNTEAELAQVSAFAGREDLPAERNYHALRLDDQRTLIWERHTEFSRYTFIREGVDQALLADGFADDFDRWVEQLPGELLLAAHGYVLQAEVFDAQGVAQRFLAEAPSVGSRIADGAGSVFTDFKVGPDGFNQLLVIDHGMSAEQLGRSLRRLLEINTYWLLALLALPAARGLGPELAAAESRIESLSQDLAMADTPELEIALLERLSQLQAEIGTNASRTGFRFGASAAYYQLVERRIDELREQRISGLQTIGEFAQRRLEPAMSTARSAAERLRVLSDRTSRLTRVLATRVEINMQRQSGEVLHSMNRRVRMQLRLQQTVEGLSIAAITYYTVGLISYGAKAAGSQLGVEPSLLTGLSIPVVLVLVTYLIWRIRRRVHLEEAEDV